MPMKTNADGTIVDPKNPRLEPNNVYVIMLMTTSFFGSGEFLLWSGRGNSRSGKEMIGRIHCPCNSLTVAVMLTDVLTAPWRHLGRGSQRVTILGVVSKNGRTLDEATRHFTTLIFDDYSSALSRYTPFTASGFRKLMRRERPDTWENQVERQRPLSAIAENLVCRSCKKTFSSRALGSYEKKNRSSLRLSCKGFHKMRFGCPDVSCEGVALVYVLPRLKNALVNPKLLTTRSWGMEDCEMKTAAEMKKAGEWGKTVMCWDMKNKAATSMAEFPVGGTLNHYI
ncbi:hypothetical protein TrVE_jg5125 [Triparma verrucosa]|uniref:Uncharacterized protein n=1 Tax=Triparma verrucosa TaxID=1606542 RepID=A0A9W7BBQ1_9STRA|nr:hypothetical protein TrVE_jg5125 [Triparma verrucosa]